MPTPKGYTTEEKIENYILQDIDSSYSSSIDGWIAGVEKIIDQHTGRNFIADAVATARLFDGDGTQELLIDDCIEITVVEAGNDDYGGNFDTISASGADRYFTEPANAIVKGFPISSLVLRSRKWPMGMQNNRITAKWGYSEAAPADIEFVATVFMSGILNQQRQGGDEIKSERIGNYQVTYNTDKGNNSFADFEEAKRILDRYTKHRI